MAVGSAVFYELFCSILTFKQTHDHILEGGFIQELWPSDEPVQDSSDFVPGHMSFAHSLLHRHGYGFRWPIASAAPLLAPAN